MPLNRPSRWTADGLTSPCPITQRPRPSQVINNFTPSVSNSLSQLPTPYYLNQLIISALTSPQQLVARIKRGQWGIPIASHRTLVPGEINLFHLGIKSPALKECFKIWRLWTPHTHTPYRGQRLGRPGTAELPEAHDPPGFPLLARLFTNFPRTHHGSFPVESSTLDHHLHRCSRDYLLRAQDKALSHFQDFSSSVLGVSMFFFSK